MISAHSTGSFCLLHVHALVCLFALLQKKWQDRCMSRVRATCVPLLMKTSGRFSFVGAEKGPGDVAYVTGRVRVSWQTRATRSLLSFPLSYSALGWVLIDEYWWNARAKRIPMIKHSITPSFQYAIRSDGISENHFSITVWWLQAAVRPIRCHCWVEQCKITKYSRRAS